MCGMHLVTSLSTYFACYNFYVFQTQEEVLDLKHAAPFQNIIPKPYIPPKGKLRYAFPVTSLYLFLAYPSLPANHPLSCSISSRFVFSHFKYESSVCTEMHSHALCLHVHMHMFHTKSPCCSRTLQTYAGKMMVQLLLLNITG